MHEDLCYWLEEKLDFTIDRIDEEYFTRKYDWIRLRIDSYLMIVEVPKDTPSSNQWWALEDWLLYCEEKYPQGHELNLLICQDTYPIQVELDFNKEVFVEDIMKLLKKYYSTHRLEM